MANKIQIYHGSISIYPVWPIITQKQISVFIQYDNMTQMCEPQTNLLSGWMHLTRVAPTFLLFLMSSEYFWIICF